MFFGSLMTSFETRRHRAGTNHFSLLCRGFLSRLSGLLLENGKIFGRHRPSPNFRKSIVLLSLDIFPCCRSRRRHCQSPPRWRRSPDWPFHLQLASVVAFGCCPASSSATRPPSALLSLLASPPLRSCFLDLRLSRGPLADKKWRRFPLWIIFGGCLQHAKEKTDIKYDRGSTQGEKGLFYAWSSLETSRLVVLVPPKYIYRT